jgi:hypothetical protein
MHDPGASGDLILYLPGFRIDQIEMVPAIAFGHPDNFASGIKEISMNLVGIVNERFADFLSDGSHLSRYCIDADQADDLMAPLIVEEG